MSKAIKPLGDCVLVQRDEQERAVGSIALPDQAIYSRLSGKVVAVGDGIITRLGARIVPNIPIGQRVSFPHECSNEVRLDGKTYAIIHTNDIIGELT